MSIRLGRFTSLIGPGERARWLGVVVFALAISGLEAIGAVLVYGLISLTTDPGGSIELPGFGDVRTRLPDMTQDDLVITAAIGIAVFFVLRAFVVLAQQYYQTRVARLTGVELSVRLLQRYLRLPYAFHLRRNSSELLRNTHDSVNELLGSVLIPIVRLLSEGLVVAAMVIVLLATAPLATGLAAVVMAPVVFLTMRSVQPKLARQGRITQQQGARGYQALQQSLHGYRDITVLGRQDFFVDLFRSTRLRIAEAHIKRAVLLSIPRVSIEAAVISFIAGFIALSTLLGTGAQQSLPILGLFAYAALRIMPSLNQIMGSLNAMRFGGPALDIVQADLALPVLPAEREVQRLPFTDALRLERVYFSYEDTVRPTLHDIDLVISVGESIGIVGPTGAGKSTLLDLIVGLSPPTHGSLTVDGVELRGHEAGWHQNLGLVSQQVFLLDDTLRRNIALGVPDVEIDDEAVREAVRLAQLDEFVSSLPRGLDTLVGERGARVSGGQRQRVAIARALYTRPSILIFDEGTSALDNLTEAALIKAISGLRGRHTIITVAHRLSTVQDYDRIVFMQDGRIDDVGRFQELIHRNAAFQRFTRWSDPSSA